MKTNHGSHVPPALLLLAAVLTGSHDANALGWSRGFGGPPATGFLGMAHHEASGSTVAFGGVDGAATSTTRLFDGLTWTMGPAAPAGLAPRSHVAMAYDRARGVVVLFGGMDTSTAYGDTWEWNGTSWSPGAAAPAALTPRSGAAMAFDARRQRIVMIGGAESGSPPLAEIWEYDGTAWTPGATPPPAFVPRWRATAAFDEARAVVVVFGGANAGWLGDTWEYDGATFVPGPAAPPALAPRAHAGMAWDATRQGLVLFGGRGSFGALGDVWLYDGAAWTPGPPPPADLHPRVGPGMVWDAARARITVHGGSGTAFGFNDTWELDAAGWRLNPSLPLARYSHALAYDAARQVAVLFGGTTAAGIADDLWEFDGEAWTRRLPAGPRPGPRTGPAMTYDSGRQRIVMFGGGGPQAGQETWEWDGSAWTLGPVAPAGLTSRESAALAYDPLRQRSVLFGGWGPDVMGNPTTLDDTWEYDGVAWTAGPAAPAGMRPRRGHAMAFDPNRGVVMLFGGFDPPDPLDDVWEYDGASWRSGVPVPALVSARLAHTMTFDSFRGTMVIFGGGTDPAPGLGSVFTDVWELQGSAWNPGTPGPPEIGGRKLHAAYFDASRHRLVVFGGLDARYALRGDTWEYGSVHAAVLAGAGFGQPSPNRIKSFDDAGQPAAFDVTAYGAGTWGAVARAAQISGSAPAEVITGPGPGPVHGPHVRGFLASGASLAKVSYYAYGTLRYGVDVNAGDLDGDGWDEIVTGPGPGPVFGPHVRGFDLDGAAPAALPGVSFFAYGTPKYGVTVAGGAVDGDTFDEILTGAGAGPTFAPHVRGFDVDGTVARPIPTLNFAMAGWLGGHGALPAAGDVDGDGRDEIGVASGPGPAVAKQIAGMKYDGQSVSLLFGQYVVGIDFGARLALADQVVGPEADVILASGPDPNAWAFVEVLSFDGAGLATALTYSAFSGGYGANLGAGALGL